MRMPLNEKIREDVHAAEWEKQSARIHTPLNEKKLREDVHVGERKNVPGDEYAGEKKKRAGVSLPDGQGMSK